jgi:hypothetical protein
MIGYVYVLFCWKHFTKVKIGFTTKTPNKRRNDIQREMQTKVHIVFYVPCLFPEIVEKGAHLFYDFFRLRRPIMKGKKVSGQSEWFLSLKIDAIVIVLCSFAVTHYFILKIINWIGNFLFN